MLRVVEESTANDRGAVTARAQHERRGVAGVPSGRVPAQPPHGNTSTRERTLARSTVVMRTAFVECAAMPGWTPDELQRWLRLIAAHPAGGACS